MASSPDHPARQTQPPAIAVLLPTLATPRIARPIRTCGGLVALIALIWYMVFLVARMGICARGSDTSGYANNAKLIREGRLFADQRRIEGVKVNLPAQVYVPLGFEPAGENRMFPTYPPGLSALFAIASTGTSLATGMTLAMGLQLLGSLGAI